VRLALLAVALLGAGAVHAQGSNATRGRAAAVHAFLLDLISAPEFPTHARDIVVEFGSAHYQPVLDQYLNGDDVPRDALQEVWRGTGQWLVWDSPVYERFFAAVRARNASLPPDRRLRVWLGDPPIHWPEVRSAADYRRFAERDAHFADLVHREVVARGRRALLIMGGMHFLRRGPLDVPPTSQRAGVGELLVRRYPDSLFVVWTMLAAPGEAAALGLGSTVRFRRLRGTPPDARASGGWFRSAYRCAA
jgi:hypothetical protein